MTVAAAAGSQAELTTRYGHALMNTFGAPKRIFVRGEGAHLWDADGNKYLDLLAGLAVLWSAAFLAVDAPVCARQSAPVEWLPCLDPDRQDSEVAPDAGSSADRTTSRP